MMFGCKTQMDGEFFVKTPDLRFRRNRSSRKVLLSFSFSLLLGYPVSTVYRGLHGRGAKLKLRKKNSRDAHSIPPLPSLLALN